MNCKLPITAATQIREAFLLFNDSLLIDQCNSTGMNRFNLIESLNSGEAKDKTRRVERGERKPFFLLGVLHFNSFSTEHYKLFSAFVLHVYVCSIPFSSLYVEMLDFHGSYCSRFLSTYIHSAQHTMDIIGSYRSKHRIRCSLRSLHTANETH